MASSADFIAALPADGCVCIVHSHAIVSAYRAAIARRRGGDVAAVTRVIAAPTLQDEVAATDGLALPVFRDPFVDAQRNHRLALQGAGAEGLAAPELLVHRGEREISAGCGR